tara:strand:- start:148 stop:330 length:183 start_codon:yes stop_codon:yes gene_type:complete
VNKKKKKLTTEGTESTEEGGEEEYPQIAQMTQISERAKGKGRVWTDDRGDAIGWAKRSRV